MADSKQGLNLAGVTVANLKKDLLDLASVIENQLTPKANAFASAMQKAGVGGGAGGAGGGGNKVASSGAEGGGGGGGGLNAFGKIGFGMQAAMSVGNFLANAMPSASTMVQQDLLTTQSAFYGQGGFGGTLGQQSANVRALQNALANRGIATNNMDTTRALSMAQSLGLSGAGNFNQVMMGAGTASNFAPGIGVSGAMQAMGTMNAPSTVNMLQTVGIRVRGPNGEVMPIPQIVEKLWNLITQNGQVPLSTRDIQIGLMPGNGLYGMLTSLYGNDQMTFTLVSNMLLAKARSGGKMNLATADRADLEKMGLTTATVNKMARQTAGQTALLTEGASAGAAAYGLSADLGNALNRFVEVVPGLTDALSAVAGGYTGGMGLGNGTMGTLLKTGAAALAGGSVAGLPGAAIAVLSSLFLGREKGGPVDSQTPYVVGEKGPELFVPTSDGVIVPNGMFREGGGGVTKGGSYGAYGPKTALTDTQLKNVLTAAGFKGESLSTAMAVARAESGGRPGALNPNASTGDYSMGLFQVNMIGDLGKRRNAKYLKEYADIGYTGPESLYDPKINAAIAFDISKSGTKWTDAWVNTSKKLGITGSSSTSSSNYSSGSSSSTISPGGSSSDYSASIQSLLSASASAVGLGGGGGFGGSAVTYNNGPLTINISGVKDTKALASEVQKILEDKYRVQKTGDK